MNSQNQLSNQHRQSAFGVIQCHNVCYRVNNLEFQEKLALQLLLDLFWISIIIISSTLLISQLIQTPSIEISICALTLANICLTILALFKRSFISKTLIASISLFTLFTTAACILYGLKIPYLMALCLVYSGIQILLTFVFGGQLSLILLKSLLLAQLCLIGCKMDNIIDTNWQLVLIPLCIIFLGLIGTACFLLGYAFINQLCSNQPNALTKYGVVFLCSILLSFALQLSIPLTWFYVTPSLIIPACVNILLHVWFIVFGACFEKEIAIFMSNKINSVSNNPEDSADLCKRIYNISNQLKLYRVSQNWFVSQNKDLISKVQLIAYPKQQCLVCMSEESVMVWMPCGHLAVCSKCSSYLVEVRKRSCILCKTKCKLIHKLKTQALNECSYKISEDRGYLVEYTEHISSN